MILFFNVLVTNHRISGPNSCDRLDLFKYSLSSYSCIDIIKDVIIYCELDPSYKHREQELKEYIDLIFKGKNISFNNYSPCNQEQWQKALQDSNILNTTEPILYSGNDDHVFIDYDLTSIYEGIKLLKNEPDDQINNIAISHWPEAIGHVYPRGFIDRGIFWEREILCPIAIKITNNKFFEHLFFNLQLGDRHFRRTDHILINIYPDLGDFAAPSTKPHPKMKTFFPIKGEMVRHFDAYNIYVNIPHSICPPLKIPNGFFKNDIKINYCGKPKENFYNINPLGGEGIDDQKLLEDLPLFWKDKISIIEDNSDQSKIADLVNARNLNHKNLITASCLNLEEKYIKIGYRK
jgi:hypothetical protein